VATTAKPPCTSAALEGTKPMPETCDVCGGDIPDDYDKFDDEAPVYGPEAGDVHHLGCQDELFENVCCEVDAGEVA
jgi:hypothetical protein